MIVAGTWTECDDGITRPVVVASIATVEGTFVDERFLIDTGADCTVLAATLLPKLSLPANRAADVSGVGGAAASARLTTSLRFQGTNGRSVRPHGEFTTFLDPKATDLSILGRDVLDHFDLVVSRRRGEVLLLFADHRYEIPSVGPQHPSHPHE